MSCEYIDIPLDSGSGGVRFFPDELPVDHIDLIDVLRSEIPPLKIWKRCAIEYFKQGEENAFHDILEDVISSVEHGSVERYDKSLQENAEAIADINIAKAAKELWAMVKLKNQPHSAQSNELYELSFKRFIDLERSVSKMNEYIWLIKGFVQIVQGDFKGAEDNFRQVYETATKLQTKKKYLFGSLIGKGILEFHHKRFPGALENFAKALTLKPDFDISLKIVISICFYRMGQLERARLALERTLHQGIGINQLILLSLIELDRSKTTDQEQRCHSQQKFHDYLVAANNIDRTNAVVLNLLANHYFSSWKKLQGLQNTQLCEPTKILSADTKFTSAIEVGSVLRIERKEYIVTGATEVGSAFSITLSQPIENIDLPIDIADLDIKDYKSAKDFAQRAAKHTTIGLVRSESYYILGKILQAQKRFKLAYDYFKRSYDESSEMTLAYFGAAQVLFSVGDYVTALDLFEKIKATSNIPDDRDTQAYIGLLRGIVKEELMSFDSIKEVAPSFAYEYELWLSQGQLRLKKPAEHLSAMKCLMEAKATLHRQRVPYPFDLLLNISTLYQYLGNFAESKEYSRLAIDSYAEVGGEVPRELLLHWEFENFYYNWSEDMGEIVQNPRDPQSFRIHIPITRQHLIQVGSDLRVNGIVWTIKNIVSKEEIVAETLFGGWLLMHNESHPFQVRISKQNFCDATILCSYNYARALEDEHRLYAASMLYQHIAKLHPSFVDVYVRLSCISRTLNKLHDSKKWLAKAKLCKEEHAEFDIIMSDLYLACDEPDKAKEILASAYLKNRSDAQILVANGNFCLDTYNRKRGDESQLNHSYKYFHPALQSHIRNLYAAHGLGIVCALKGQLEAGHSILEKIRNASGGRKLLLTLNFNLAYISFLEGKYPDAERLLISLYRELIAHSDSSEVRRCLGLLSVVQHNNQHYDDCFRSISKSLHLNPLDYSMWYNYSVSALATSKHDMQEVLLKRIDKVLKIVGATTKNIDMTDIQLCQKVLKSKRRKFEHDKEGTNEKRYN